MHGKIIVYCRDVLAGVIRDSAGRSYLFSSKNWMSHPQLPLANTQVEFNLSNGWAFDVTAMMPPVAAAAAMSPLRYASLAH